MIVSFSKPWWTLFFETGRTVNIYGWGLRHDLDALASYIASDVTPTWQSILAWIYIGISTVLALGSTWLKKWWGALIQAVIGTGFIVYAYVAINMVVKNRLEILDIALEGHSLIDIIGVNASIKTGYYLAYAADGAMVVLALLRLVMPKNDNKLGVQMEITSVQKTEKCSIASRVPVQFRVINWRGWSGRPDTGYWL
jgi:uncharacterized membrane protein YeaQ/YmgE (transglycosylase-associated protein family)